MAILGFHFSGVYKDDLFSGNKTATVMDNEHYFRIGEEVLVYLSDKPNLFDGNIEKRIGKAIIEEVQIKKVNEITELEAKLCGSESLEKLKKALYNWYGADEDSIITFIRYKLTLE